jgi:hypothetical protein
VRNRRDQMEGMRAARLARVGEARTLARKLGRDGSFAILVSGDESRPDPRTGEPRAIWFSEYELEDGHLRVHRHSEVQNQVWESFSYTSIWAAADESLAKVLGVIKELPEDALLTTMLENNSHVRWQHERGNMGLGIPHQSSRNR